MRGRLRRDLMGIAAAALLIGGHAGPSASAGRASAGDPTAAPANYRQAVAAKLRQMEDVKTITSPQITRPHVRWMGLINGGSRPVVCVKLVRPNVLGTPAVYFYLFYFDNGIADGYQQGAINPLQAAMIGCQGEPLSPFTELTRRR